MPDKVNKYYAVSPAMLNSIIANTVKATADAVVERAARAGAAAGIEAFQKQDSERQKREEKARDPAKQMKEILSAYRRIKKNLQEEIEYTPEEQQEYRLRFLQDLMGDPIKRHDRTERLIQDREEKRRLDQYRITQIDQALESYRKECEQSENEEQMRRYRILRMYYIDDPAMSVEKIAESEMVSDKTVYRDLNIACGIMYQYVIGL